VPKSNYFPVIRKITPDTAEKPTVIRSIFRAVDILICLSNGYDNISDIAKQSKLSNSTTHRLLKTLEELQLATYDPMKHRYYMGPLINQLSSNPQTTHLNLITCAAEEMKRLWDMTGETVALNLMIGILYVRLFDMISRHKLKVIEGDDPVGPVYVGATAKVLLSQLTDEELKIAVKNITMRRVTEHSITDKAVLTAQSRQIRQHGYAISYGERIPGALCVSVPVKNYTWPVALSIIGPESRVKSSVDELVKELMISASRISGNLSDFFQTKEVIKYSQIIREKQLIQNQ
jgi:DNA-binding IclR family transcriptional regulator